MVLSGVLPCAATSPDDPNHPYWSSIPSRIVERSCTKQHRRADQRGNRSIAGRCVSQNEKELIDRRSSVPPSRAQRRCRPQRGSAHFRPGGYGRQIMTRSAPNGHELLL